jgi:hypothetical protein
MNMQNGQRHGMQDEDGHAAWRWTFIMDNGHAAWTWTSPMDMDIPHVHERAA